MRFVARHDGADIPLEVERFGSGYRVKLGERWVVADLVDAGPTVRSLRLEDGTQYSLLHHRQETLHVVTLSSASIHVEITDPLALRRKGRADEASTGGMVRAMMPGRIVRVLVARGQAVAKGAGLMILEAMKMENEIVSPVDGIVEQLFVEPGHTVEAGAELAHIG
jgi:biotin carboxyl carrier protein